MNDYLNEIKVSTSIGEIINYPNKFDIINYSIFGNPDWNHSFASENTIEHILFFIFQSEYLSQVDTTPLLSSTPTVKSSIICLHGQNICKLKFTFSKPRKKFKTHRNRLWTSKQFNSFFSSITIFTYLQWEIFRPIIYRRISRL